MLQKQDVATTGADNDDRFCGFHTRWQLPRGTTSLCGLSELPSSAAQIPRAEIRILDRLVSRFAGGLLRCLVPSILAGTCLTGGQGKLCAAQPSTEQNSAWPGENGTASYYGPRHQGHRTASGAPFEQTELTAAHPWLPFGTRVRVTVASGRSIVVTITDRLPARRRVIDLSLAAARLLGIVSQGIAHVSLTPA
jgi:rare lipoprotein A